MEVFSCLYKIILELGAVNVQMVSENIYMHLSSKQKKLVCAAENPSKQSKRWIRYIYSADLSLAPENLGRE